MVYPRITLIVVLEFSMACSFKHVRIHDETRYLESQKALELWTKVQAEPTLKVALSNLDKVAKADLESVAISARSNFIANAQLIPASSWEETRSGLDRVLRNNKKERDGLQEEQNKLAKDVSQLMPALKAAEAALSQAKASLVAEEAGPDPKASQDALDAVIKSAQQLGEVKKPQSPGDVEDLFDNAKDVKESLERLGVILDKLKSSSHTGLAPVLSNYARDVARAASDRVKEEIRHANALQATNTIRIAILDQAINDNEKVKNRFEPYPQTEKVLTTLQSLSMSASNARSLGFARPDNSETELANVLDGLHRYSASFGYEKYYERVERHRRSMEIHAHRRRVDEINAREREQLILRGLQALMLFHHGGLTGQDIARLINIGELAGIMVRQ